MGFVVSVFAAWSIDLVQLVFISCFSLGFAWSDFWVHVVFGARSCCDVSLLSWCCCLRSFCSTSPSAVVGVGAAWPIFIIRVVFSVVFRLVLCFHMVHWCGFCVGAIGWFCGFGGHRMVHGYVPFISISLHVLLRFMVSCTAPSVTLYDVCLCAFAWRVVLVPVLAHLCICAAPVAILWFTCVVRLLPVVSQFCGV